MDFNLDMGIFIGFLVANLIFGIWSSRGINSIREYAVGNRNFSTTTIAATLVATWVSGDTFFTQLSEVYSNGLYFVWAQFGEVVCFLLIGLLFAPRMGEFLGKLSIAEAMGDLYGNKVRVVTSISGFIGAAGMIAMQLKVAGLLFEYCFGINNLYGIIIGGTIITMYSSLGGIKSVTLTDVIQLFTFGTIIPTIAFFILGTADDTHTVVNTVTGSDLFDYRKVFNFSDPKAVYYLFLFIFIAIPGFNPAIFQRIAMAKNISQVKQSFTIAAFTCFVLTSITFWIGTIILATQPSLNSNDIVKHILYDYSIVGLRGLTLVGIMAMVMSTADSYINSTSILIIHDFCKPLRFNLFKGELVSSRIASAGIGIFAIALALKSGSLLELLITTNMFYMPIVTVPFIMSIFGFRSSNKSVLIGMGGGFFGVVIWELFLKTQLVDGLVPGMITNLIFLFGSHYLLNQPGGWIKVRDDSTGQSTSKKREIFSSVRNFNLVTLCRKNSPSGEAAYVYLGLFCIVSIYSTMHTIPKYIQLEYTNISRFIYLSTFFISTVLISYPLWPSSWKDKAIISIIWNLTTFYVLICIGFLFVIMSNFAQLQLMIFMINLIIVAILLRWQWALAMIVVGVCATTKIFTSYLRTDIIPGNFVLTQFEIIYLLLLVSSILIAFIKPKQEYQELTEKKVGHLSGRIDYQANEIDRAMDLKNEFIRNIKHEYHAPMTGIISNAEILFKKYDDLPDKLRKRAVEDIYKSIIRLDRFDSNINDLARLERPTHELNKNVLNFSELVENRINGCIKFYVEERDKENRSFSINIEPNLQVKCDKHFIEQTLDNLIINAIMYCKAGEIKISLKKALNQTIEFEIQDEGIGIPIEELEDIFKAFIVSSRTHTPAGGRGIGLALCKKVVDMHGGTIKAESDRIEGTMFKFNLPING